MVYFASFLFFFLLYLGCEIPLLPLLFFTTPYVGQRWLFADRPPARRRLGGEAGRPLPPPGRAGRQAAAVCRLWAGRLPSCCRRLGVQVQAPGRPLPSPASLACRQEGLRRWGEKKIILSISKQIPGHTCKTNFRVCSILSRPMHAISSKPRLVNLDK